MNVFVFELKMYKKSIIIWTLAISLSLFAYMAFYPTMAADTEAFEQLMSNYPEEILAFFGMNAELPMSSILGYFGLTYSMILIPIAIQASNYGFHMLSVEERELTADFLLSKPISRTKIMVSKFLAALTSLVIVNIAVWIASIAALQLFKGDATFNMGNVLVLLSSLIIFQLFFISVGMVISVSLRKISSVLSYSMALAFGLYILSALKSLFSSVIFGLLSPYSHFDAVEILLHGKYDLIPTIISVFVIVISLTMSYFLYLKRNIHSL
ncbi:ABC transporter permease subunit [Mycoplasmatota bacterium WC44]